MRRLDFSLVIAVLGTAILMGLFCYGAVVIASSTPVDTFAQFATAWHTPPADGFAITPSDSAQLTYVTRAIYVGGAGNLTLVMKGGETLTFDAVPAGTTFEVRAVQVKETGTTATDLVGLY